MRATLFSSLLFLAASATHSPLSSAQQPAPNVVSQLQTIAASSTEQLPKTVYSAPTQFEAPNWSRDGQSLYFDQGGSLFRIPVSGGTPQPVPMGEGMRCNGSHGVSPDGTLLAVSCSSPAVPGSHVYVLPANGGTPRLVTEHSDSYFHTWSPDGKTIVFTRPRHGFIAISVDGGQEKPLISGDGIDDDPDFSPDGKFIYFNSDRSGSMQIWRMHSDGTGLEQITTDDHVNWTPHPSPDGRWVLILSYAPGTQGHPSNQPITLRLLSTSDKKLTTLVHLTGGSGTDNTPCWAPDSQHLAYVSYQPAKN